MVETVGAVLKGVLGPFYQAHRLQGFVACEHLRD